MRNEGLKMGSINEIDLDETVETPRFLLNDLMKRSAKNRI